VSRTTTFPVELSEGKDNTILNADRQAFVCTHCGEAEAFPPMPMRVDAFVALTKAFIDRHDTCHLPPPTKALSLRQPWAWLMIHGPKDIENRPLRWKFRGRILVHAAAGMTRQEYYEAVRFAAERGVTVPPMAELARGGIIGEMTITGCYTAHPSPWFMGPYGYTTIGRKPLPYRPCKGMLGLFTPPPIDP